MAAAGGALRGEGRLVGALLLLVVLSNVPYGGYVLYPFALFGTWVHEVGHALAALAVGGRVDHLQLFPDTSGLAYTATGSRLAQAVVASAGYTGTALVGGLLLAFRRHPEAGRVGLALLGLLMLGTGLLWVRNGFGLLVVGVLGLGLLGAGLRLPRPTSLALYTFLAAATALNSITSIRALFGSVQQVNGQPAGMTDARAVADLLVIPWFLWASGWFVLALVCTWGGLRVAWPARVKRLRRG